MRYHEQALGDIAQKYSEIDGIRDQLVLRLLTAEAILRQTTAKKYLLHGVARRLGILTRCVHNVFRIFPIEQTERLELGALTDLEINLHAFFVNISGLFDNLGWAFAIENNLVGTSKEGKLGRYDIGLFSKKNQVHFPSKLRTYLNSQEILDWYSTYSKNYRDALAHRIPMYVPPFVLNEEEQARYFALEEQLQKLDVHDAEHFLVYDQLRQKQQTIGKPSLVFMHDSEESLPVVIHQQMLIDYITVEEVLNVFCESVWPTFHNEKI